jgi:hypothetical protein
MENDTLKKALDFLIETAPELAKEFVRYEQITAMIEAPFMVLIWVWIFLFWKKKEHRTDLNDCEHYAIFLAIITFIVFFITLKFLEMAIMIFSYPNLWLLKYGIKTISTHKRKHKTNARHETRLHIACYIGRAVGVGSLPPSLCRYRIRGGPMLLKPFLPLHPKTEISFLPQSSGVKSLAGVVHRPRLFRGVCCLVLRFILSLIYGYL